MSKMIIFLTAQFLIFPMRCRAELSHNDGGDQIIKAEVLEILEEREMERENDSKYTQQNIKLKGLGGDFKNKEFIFTGISDFDVVSAGTYEKGDKVLVNYFKDYDGKDIFQIIDYVRSGKLYLMFIIFISLTIIAAGFKGARAIFGLGMSFFIIMKFIIPKILSGSSPLGIAILGAFLILLFVIYFTEGFNRRAHLAILSILICLAFTGFLSSLFSNIANLGGMAGEEAMFLIGISKFPINFKGLLLAGIIIGTLGVLDDVAISQLSIIEQIKTANKDLTDREVYKKAFSVGVAHISSMTNTLFLTCAGASLPLLLLFSVKEPPFLGFSSIINNELIATEIMRTLAGSIGLIMVVPISTFLGVKFLKK